MLINLASHLRYEHSSVGRHRPAQEAREARAAAVVACLGGEALRAEVNVAACIGHDGWRAFQTHSALLRTGLLCGVCCAPQRNIDVGE